MAVITRVITGDTPASVSLLTLTDAQTGVAIGGISLPAAFAASGSAWSVAVPTPTPGQVYAYTYRRTWGDGSYADGTGTLTTAATLPVSRADLLAYLRIGAGVDDAVVDALNQYATDFIQREAQQQLLTLTKTAYFDHWPGHPLIGRDTNGYPLPSAYLGYDFGLSSGGRFAYQRTLYLPDPPLQSVSSVKYVTGGILTTLDPSLYAVSISRKPGRIVLAAGRTWPDADLVPDAVQVTYTCGYGNPAQVPSLFVQAIKWLVGHAYENREATAPQTISELPFGLQHLIGTLMFREANAA